MLTLFHPQDGELRVQGVTRATNAILHPWLKEQCPAILSSLPDLVPEQEAVRTALWERWQQGLTRRFTLPQQLPPLRMLLVWDNLAGHSTREMGLWLVAQGIMPLYTPLGGSWLNMAESVQRILVRRALDGQSPEIPQQIIAALEATAKGWNQDPTPFIWGASGLLVGDAAANADRRSAGQALALISSYDSVSACSRNGSIRTKRPNSTTLVSTRSKGFDLVSIDIPDDKILPKEEENLAMGSRESQPSARGGPPR